MTGTNDPAPDRSSSHGRPDAGTSGRESDHAGAGRDALRVGDAERDAVALALHEHFAAGRLDRAELDERLDAALAAKTLGDLRDVVRDLPEPNGLPAPEREPAPVPAAFGPGPFGPGWFGPGPFGPGRRGPRGHHGHGHHAHGHHGHGHHEQELGAGGEYGPAAMWVPGRPTAWVGAGHPAWQGHHRRRAVFPMLAVLFGVLALSAGVGTALLTVFHVVVVLWIVRAAVLLVHTRRHRRALR